MTLIFLENKKMRTLLNNTFARVRDDEMRSNVRTSSTVVSTIFPLFFAFPAAFLLKLPLMQRGILELFIFYSCCNLFPSTSYYTCGRNNRSSFLSEREAIDQSEMKYYRGGATFIFIQAVIMVALQLKGARYAPLLIPFVQTLINTGLAYKYLELRKIEKEHETTNVLGR